MRGSQKIGMCEGARNENEKKRRLVTGSGSWKEDKNLIQCH